MRRLIVAGFVVTVGIAHAHVGATVSKATFTSPPQPSAQPNADGGLVLQPYPFATADTEYPVAWSVDYPMDPTGKFDFYYLDHQLSTGWTYDNALAAASPIPEASGANQYWVSCSCSSDMGVTCPTDTRINCSKLGFTWDTSHVPAGVYWLFAFNNDPPYKIYTSSQGPVRVAHDGGTPAPAVTIILPDGLFAYDKSTPVLWEAAGTPPFRFDLSYGPNTDPDVMKAPLPLASNLTPPANADGSFGYTWDTSKLDDGFYYVRIQVTDATGQSSYTNSFYGVNVYHPPADGGFVIDHDLSMAQRPDLSIVLKQEPSGDGGCGCGVGAASTVAPAALGLLFALLVMLGVRRRRDSDVSQPL